jgi:GBP family porin
MKKSLFALVALATVSGVAQAEVQLYGVLDVAVGSINHSLPGSPTFPATVDPVDPQKQASGGYANGSNSVTGMFNGGISPTRWGIKGAEDLGGGLKAVFTLESGFNLPSGAVSSGAAAASANNPNVNQVFAATSINGQLFDRQAWAGLSDAKLGQLTFGRVYSPAFDIVVGYDPVQAAQLFSPLGFSGTWGGSLGSTEDLRNDNTMRYSNKIGDVNFGGMYKFGNQSGNNSAMSGWEVNAGYEASRFGIQGAYGAFKDVFNAGYISSTSPSQFAGMPVGSIAVSEFNTQGYMVAAKYKITDAGTVKAGYQHFTRSAPSDVFTVATAPAYYGYQVGKVSALTESRDFYTYWVGGDYYFTPSFNVGIGYYDLGYQASASGAQKDGDIRFYSLLADYSFSKRTDVYLGLMIQNSSGPNFPEATYETSNAIYAVGMRHRF